MKLIERIKKVFHFHRFHPWSGERYTCDCGETRRLKPAESVAYSLSSIDSFMKLMYFEIESKGKSGDEK